MKWLKTGLKFGSAVGKTTTDPVQKLESLEIENSSSVTFASVVMDQDVSSLLIAPAMSSTSADTIGSPGFSNTVWTENLQKVAELSCDDLSDLSLEPLPQNLRTKLEQLSDSASEPCYAIVHKMAEFFVQQESDYCEGPLLDGVMFYLETQVT